MKTLSYEWDIETVDVLPGRDVLDPENDILDHDQYDKCPTRPLGPNERLVLVRTELRPGYDNSRWAYVRDGQLPDWFTDSYNRPVASVPARFHRELSKARGASEALTK